MYNFIYFLLFFAIFSSAIILFFLIKKDQEKKIKEYFFKKKTMSDDGLELISTYEIIKELKKRENPPLFIAWIDKDDFNKINYFIFKKNIEKKISLLILNKMIRDIEYFS